MIHRAESVDLLTRVMRSRDAEVLACLTAANWADLLGQARVTRLGARLCRHVDDLGGGRPVPMPDGARRHLRAEALRCERQMDFMAWELHRVQDALADLGQPVLLLKGAAYLAAGLPPAQGRLFADIDLMVPAEAIGRTEAALLLAGWLSFGHSAYDERYYRQWMHEIPPLTHVQRGTVIDLHHTLTPPTSRYRVDAASLLAAARPLPGLPALYMLQPVDLVLHSAVHLSCEGEFGHGLRDLMDICLLLQHFAQTEPGFWPALLARAGELGLQVPLHHALWHIQRLFGQSPPAPWARQVGALAPSWPQRWLMAALLSRALRPDHPSCSVLGERWARQLLYVRSHWLRMPLRLLLPHLLRKAWLSVFPEAADEPDRRTQPEPPPAG